MFSLQEQSQVMMVAVPMVVPVAVPVAVPVSVSILVTKPTTKIVLIFLVINKPVCKRFKKIQDILIK